MVHYRKQICPDTLMSIYKVMNTWSAMTIGSLGNCKSTFICVCEVFFFHNLPEINWFAVRDLHVFSESSLENTREI